MDILEIESIFEYKTPSPVKLEKYGFKASNNGYIKAIPIMKRQFMMQVAVAADKDLSVSGDTAFRQLKMVCRDFVGRQEPFRHEASWQR